MTDFKPSDLSQLDRAVSAVISPTWTSITAASGQTSKNRQLVFNYAKIAIDKITSYLMTGLEFSAFEPLNTPAIASAAKQSPANAKSTDTAKRAEDLIYQVLDQNNCGELDYTTEIDSAILGDGCYKVTWDAIEKRIRITAPDVNGLYAWWTGDDLTRVYQVASRYQLSQAEILLLYKKTTQKKTVQMTELWTAKDFILYMDNDIIDRKPNPYGFIPFIIYPNLRQPKQFWGISDIPTLQEPQKELNRALSQLSRILEVSGNPIAVLEGVESSEDIQVRPGAVWNIPPDTKAYLLDFCRAAVSACISTI